VTISLNLILQRDFRWRFLVADVAKPILGADSLAYYNLLPDLTNSRLLDSTALLAARGEVTAWGIPSIKTVVGSSTYHQLLQQYPSITHPNGALGKAPHDPLHHIIMTPGPPVAQKP
jgi:cleavage and polyadenylation specificity factor subunit 1